MTLEMIVNPFTYGNPISDSTRFVGRRLLVEQIYSRLRNVEFESSSLVGERRIGKTSLLNYIADADVRRAHGLRTDQVIFVYVDLALLDAMTTPTRLWQYLLRQIIPHLSETDAEPLHDALREPQALDNFTLAEVFDRLDAKQSHVVLLLDEFENVTRNQNFSPDFFYGLRSLAIHHHLALITSSRRELIELTHSEELRSSPFFNIFANINVRLLTEQDARALIDNALSETRVRFTPAEIDSVLRTAGTHPFFLQTACHFLFDAHTQNLDADARSEFWDQKFRLEATSHLAEYWRHCDAREKTVLAALALLPERRDKQSQAQLQNLLERSERVLAQLDKHALVAPQGDSYIPFNALFADWILETLDDKQFSQEFNTALHKPRFGEPPISTSRALANLQSAPDAGLSPRELQVLQLVATGLSDAEVAAKLVVSPRTVSTHLQSIYGKLGVNSRAAATRYAVEHHLVDK